MGVYHVHKRQVGTFAIIAFSCVNYYMGHCTHCYRLSLCRRISAFTRLDALWRYVCFGAIICSVIAIIITLCGKVDTSRYFLKRLIGTCGLVVLYGVAMSFATSMLPAVFIGIAGIAYQILRVQDDDSSKTERAVLMLSDPAIHLTVFWGIQWVSEFVKTE